MMQTIRFTLNGKPVRLAAEGSRLLLWVLRTDLGLTGTKCGCERGFCGACTVIVEGEALRSCQLPLREVAGKKVLTIEGLAGGGKLHPLQKAFAENDGLQCGFCTSGMILSAYALLAANPRPTENEIRDALEGNLCRCGSHKRVVQAVQSAAQAGGFGRRP